MKSDKSSENFKNYFPNLSELEFEALMTICEYKEYPGKSVILKCGNQLKKVFLILQGSVRGYVFDEKGNEKNILLRSKGIFVGDAEAIFGDMPQKLTIESLDYTRVLLFSITDFENLAEHHKGIQKIYLYGLKEAILRLTYRVHSLITLNSEQRYLDLLKKNPDFLKDAYDKYVANYLGITAVSFSRIKKGLKNKAINK